MTSDAGTVPVGLDALEARLRQDLAWLELPAKPWVPPRFHAGQAVTDVVIVGAGMCGLAAAAMLKRLGIANIRVLDRAAQGSEGPWVTFARMETLRSPKQLTGPALGLPALTFRAWFESQFGRRAWDELGKIPRQQWMDYLVWYRKVLDLPVENGVTVRAIQSAGDELFRLSLEQGGAGRTAYARHVVLATGRDGLGGPYVPDIIARLDKRFWAHSAEEIDPAALAGKVVGVVGAGASAIDNAAMALENGAARVDLFVRRADLPRINKFTGIGSPGVVHGFAGLPDAWKARFLDYVLTSQTPPPRDSMLRVSRHPSARFHLASPLESVEVEEGRLLVATPRGRYRLDFLIAGTGFRVDPASRPELAEFAEHIRLWRDRFQGPGMHHDELAWSPDLGDAFEFREKRPGSATALARLHAFNYPATMSHGKLSGDIPAVSEGADRLARGIARALFVADRQKHFENLLAFDTPELLGDEWTDAGEA
jgi:cation diffusion facilitator CzcD-associated flavoprotein CzcO